ncbi:hypothetical protein AWL63_21175 [Sphingomonas panacis]|uniref:Uncharacterized protein n=1 Tax=Sphingomonas panacis TaxID=1560345 RepID=A0A1B3ZF94_9SPHN|nr:hypothetical protein AWL63_21175 [Sphingomonas panacis]
MTRLITVHRTFRFDSFVSSVSYGQIFTEMRDDRCHDCNLVQRTPPRHRTVSEPVLHQAQDFSYDLAGTNMQMPNCILKNEVAFGAGTPSTLLHYGTNLV